MEFTIYHWILVIISILIIIFYMVQPSKSDGASGALVGGGLNLFSKNKERGLQKAVTFISYYLAASFILFVLVIKIVSLPTEL